MNDYKELIETFRLVEEDEEIDICGGVLHEIADIIEQLLHERFLIGAILITESKWEIEPEIACEQIRRVLRGE